MCIHERVYLICIHERVYLYVFDLVSIWIYEESVHVDIPYALLKFSI